MRIKTAISLLTALSFTALPAAFADSWQQIYDNATQALSVESYANAQQFFEQGLKVSNDGDAAHGILMRAGLAESLLWQGKFPDSAKQFKIVIRGIKVLGDKPEVAGIYDGYAWLLQAQGKTSDAYSYVKQAVEIRKRLLPPNSAETAQSLEHLAELSEKQGLIKDAADLYGQALAICKQAGADQQIQVANITEQLAIVQNRLGNSGVAAQLFNDSLADKSAIGAVFQPYSPHSVWQTVMYRFAQGAPNCSRETVSGESLAVITTPENVIVQATVLPASDFKGATAFVRVVNNGHHQIEFLPRPPVLVELSPKVELAKLLSADKVAQQIEKKGNRKASLIRFFEGDATTPVTSTIMTNPGYVRPGWGWGGYGSGYGGPYGNGYGNPYAWGNAGPQMTTVTTYVPDYQARARAEAKAQAAAQTATDAADLIRDQKLVATTLAPGQMTQGCAQFDATDIKDGIFRVGIGNAMFEFPLFQK